MTSPYRRFVLSLSLSSSALSMNSLSSNPTPYLFPSFSFLFFQQVPTKGVDFADLRRKRKMNRCAYQQNNNNAFGACGEMRLRGSETVVCPKPRRVGFTPSIWHANYQTEVCDSRARAELLDMILPKGSYGTGKQPSMASSPPFFSGSPPSRASNPVIQDAHFGNDRPSPLPTTLGVSPSSGRKNGGCARMSLGQKPAAVRIEGFNCRGNCSVSAVA